MAFQQRKFVSALSTLSRFHGEPSSCPKARSLLRKAPAEAGSTFTAPFFPLVAEENVESLYQYCGAGCGR